MLFRSVITVALAAALLPCHSCTEPASCFRHSRLRGNDGGKAVKRRSAKRKPKLAKTKTISGIFSATSAHLLRLLRLGSRIPVFHRIPARALRIVEAACAG